MINKRLQDKLDTIYVMKRTSIIILSISILLSITVILRLVNLRNFIEIIPLSVILIMVLFQVLLLREYNFRINVYESFKNDKEYLNELIDTFRNVTAYPLAAYSLGNKDYTTKKLKVYLLYLKSINVIDTEIAGIKLNKENFNLINNSELELLRMLCYYTVGEDIESIEYISSNDLMKLDKDDTDKLLSILTDVDKIINIELQRETGCETKVLYKKAYAIKMCAELMINRTIDLMTDVMDYDYTDLVIYSFSDYNTIVDEWVGIEWVKYLETLLCDNYSSNFNENNII